MQRRAIALFTPTIKDMMNIARMADEAGFDSVWNGEFFNRNGLVTLAAVAMSTKRTKIATGIASVFGKAAQKGGKLSQARFISEKDRAPSPPPHWSTPKYRMTFLANS